MNRRAAPRPSNRRSRETVSRHGALIGQVTRALLYLLIVTLSGVLGFYVIWIAFSPNPADHSILDALYLAVITLSTVGFGDNLALLSLPEPGKTIGEVFTVLFIMVSYGVVLWTSSLIIAYAVEGALSDLLFSRRQLRRIRMFENHFILCGVGRTGVDIAAEFAKTEIPLVVIDVDPGYLEACGPTSAKQLAVLEGDATSEEVLLSAGIARARGLISNLPTDPENLFLTMTAKALNPSIRVVTGAIEPKNRDKLIRAGADNVVYPAQIGALRLASEMIRPTVVTFLDRMLRDPSRTMRVSEVVVEAGSDLEANTIEASRIHKKTGLLVLAIQDPKQPSDQFLYNPSGSHVIEAGQTLVVIGESAQVKKLKELAGQ
ncbi:potassium channel family protein [Bacteroidota bacterium]